MVVGVLKIRLGLFESHSLKDKRRVVRSLIDRTRNRFHVAIAEVDEQDVHERAVIGVAAVSNDGPHVNSVLDKVRAAISDDAIGKADILDSELEIIHV